MNLLGTFFPTCELAFRSPGNLGCWRWDGGWSTCSLWQHKLGRGHRDKLQQSMTITGAR